MYWFRRLDYYLWERSRETGDFLYQMEAQRKAQQKVVESYRITHAKSVEHLQPQNQSQNQNKWNKENLDRFGNLALITVSANSSLSNRNVEEKFSTVSVKLKDHKLQSLKLLAMYNEGDNEYWDEARALKHEKKMIDVLQASFAASPVVI